LLNDNPGLIKANNYNVTPPSRLEFKNSMESLVHHFKFYTEGTIIPAGEAYPGTSQWGIAGWTCRDLKSAERKFKSL
jgi:NADH:ubiquinone oxidoreductase subunit D